MSIEKTTIAICDDHPHILHSLENLFSSLSLYQITYKTNYGEQLLARLEASPTKIVITDFAVTNNMSTIDGFAKIKMIRQVAPDVKLLLLTSQRNPAIIRKALEYGAGAIVSKVDAIEETLRACDHLIKFKTKYLSTTILQVINADGLYLESNTMLTPKELEVIRMFSSGYSLSAIAERQHRSVSTISTQKYNAMRRLGISSNTELIRYAYANGLI